ncbi:MAG: metallophosphoesterase family protein [Lachnospiraceae bacterium]
MQLALISDIHGNYKALEAFLAYIKDKAVDGIICLGDYVTDSPYPQRTLSMLYRMMENYPCYMVRGNREQYLIDNFYKPQGWKPSSANGALYYTSRHVTGEDIRFFESLPTASPLSLAGCPAMFICHGSPTDLRGNFMENPKLLGEALRDLKEDYLLGGHSHNQELTCKFGKTYVNPGALGFAIDGKGRQAQFAMLRTVEGSEQAGGDTRPVFDVELISIPYDVDAFLQDFTVSGLDEYGMVLNRAIKKTLVTGINYFYKSVLEAIKLSGKPLPKIPEEIWNQVAERLEL